MKNVRNCGVEWHIPLEIKLSTQAFFELPKPFKRLGQTPCSSLCFSAPFDVPLINVVRKAAYDQGLEVSFVLHVPFTLKIQVPRAIINDLSTKPMKSKAERFLEESGKNTRFEMGVVSVQGKK